MDGCQNYGPFLDPYYNTAPNIWRTQKGDHNFDNHPHDVKARLAPATFNMIDSLLQRFGTSNSQETLRTPRSHQEDFRALGFGLWFHVDFRVLGLWIMVSCRFQGLGLWFEV